MWGYYKDIYPVPHLYLHSSLRIQPKSGTKRASHELKMHLCLQEMNEQPQMAALLWAREPSFCVNKLSLSLNCKQVGVDKLYFLARAKLISFPYLSKGTKPWEVVYSSKPHCLAWPRDNSILRKRTFLKYCKTESSLVSGEATGLSQDGRNF